MNKQLKKIFKLKKKSSKIIKKRKIFENIMNSKNILLNLKNLYCVIDLKNMLDFLGLLSM